MQSTIRMWLLTLAMSAVSFLIHPAHAQSLLWHGNLTETGRPDGIVVGEANSAVDINTHGIVLINAQDSTGKGAGFLWTPGNTIHLGTLGGVTEAMDLSESNPPVVVGWSEVVQPMGTEARAFRWTSTNQMQDISNLNQFVRAHSVDRISADGQTYLFANFDGKVARGNPSNPPSVAPLVAYDYSGGQGVANNTTAVGIFADGTFGMGSFLWPANGNPVQFPEPMQGAPFRVAAISSNGIWIAGDYADTSGRMYGVLLRTGQQTYIPLTTGSNIVSVTVNDVADNGYVVGTGYDRNGSPHVLLWRTPDNVMDITELIAQRIGTHCRLEMGIGLSADGYYVTGDMWNAETNRYETFAVGINFEPSTPEIIEPENNAVGGPRPTFRFLSTDPEGDSIMYILEVWKEGDGRSFETGWIGVSNFGMITIPADAPLTVGQWQWFVRALDKRGGISRPSEPRTYTVRDDANQPPEVPTLTSPIDNALTSATPTLVASSTDPNQHDIRYHFELSNGVDVRSYQTDFVPSGTPSNFVIPSTEPLAEGGWRWRARAEDILGAFSDWSQYASFTVSLTSVGEALQGRVIISPNPVTEFLSIEWQLETVGDLILDIKDVLGRTVLHRSLGTHPRGSVIIEGTALPPGTYIVVIRDGDAFYRDALVVVR